MANTAPDPARLRLTEALRRTAAGDRGALQEVYRLTSAKLFGVCLRISRDREAAEDILQDVYLKVWNRAGRFDAERSSPITWLCVIARNTAIDWQRRSGPGTLAEAFASEIADASANAPELIEAGQERARIFDCLDKLETRQSRAIRAAFFDGLTYVQLAEHMKVPLGTMKSWVRRGLMQLKGCLGDG